LVSARGSDQRATLEGCDILGNAHANLYSHADHSADVHSCWHIYANGNAKRQLLTYWHTDFYTDQYQHANKYKYTYSDSASDGDNRGRRWRRRDEHTAIHIHATADFYAASNFHATESDCDECADSNEYADNNKHADSDSNRDNGESRALPFQHDSRQRNSG